MIYAQKYQERSKLFLIPKIFICIYNNQLKSNKQMNLSLEISYNNSVSATQEFSYVKTQQESNYESFRLNDDQVGVLKTPKKAKSKKSYYWNDTENRRYIKFLQTKAELFSLSAQLRKKKKLNKLMSKAIVSRSPTQCHTHHQKMKNRYGSIEAIINAYDYLKNKNVLKTEKSLIQQATITPQITENQMKEQEMKTQDLDRSESWKYYLECFMFQENQDQGYLNIADFNSQ